MTAEVTNFVHLYADLFHHFPRNRLFKALSRFDEARKGAEETTGKLTSPGKQNVVVLFDEHDHGWAESGESHVVTTGAHLPSIMRVCLGRGRAPAAIDMGSLVVDNLFSSPGDYPFFIGDSAVQLP